MQPKVRARGRGLFWTLLLLASVEGCATKDKEKDQLDLLREQGYGFNNPQAEANRQKRIAERNAGRE